MFNFNHLYYFYMTAKVGSITEAAKHLNTSQPSLSVQLKALEDQLRQPLFRRSGRKIFLTEFGRATFGYCQQMFQVAESLRTATLLDRGQLDQRVHIGISEEIERPFIAELVSKLVRWKGNDSAESFFVIKTSTGTHDKLIQQLRFREVDAVVSQAPTFESDCSAVLNIRIPVVLAYPLRDRSHLPDKWPGYSALHSYLKDSGSKWILPAPHYRLRNEIERFLESKKLSNDCLHETDVSSSIPRSVTEGMGAALLPALYARVEWKRQALGLFGPPEGFWLHNLWLICRKQDKEQPLITRMVKTFERVCLQGEAKDWRYKPILKAS